MSAAKEAFNGGRSSWGRYDESVGDSLIDVQRKILGPANHDGTQFARCNFTGSTFEAVYFSACHFSNCTFTLTQFTSANFVDCTFEDCRSDGTEFHGGILDGVAFHGSDFKVLTFRKASVMSVRITDTVIGELALDQCAMAVVTAENCRCDSLDASGIPALDLRIRDASRVQLTLDRCKGQVIGEAVTLDVLSLTHTDTCEIVLRDSLVLDVSVEHPRDLVVFTLMSSTLKGADLRLVDLTRSTFVGSTLADCVLPVAEGSTSWLGEFVPPPNLFGQPIGDIAGIGEVHRQEIARSQHLSSLSESAQDSVGSELLFRLIGATTGHGRNVGRLVAHSVGFALLLGLLNQLHRPESASVKHISCDSRDYFALLLNLNRAGTHLSPILVDAATLGGLVLVGLVITVLTNYVVRGN